MAKNIRRFILICAFLIIICSGCTKAGSVASKTTLGGIDVGGMTREEAIAVLTENKIDPGKSVTITAEGNSLTIAAGEIGAEYDTEKSVDNAIAKSKGLFSGWFKSSYPMAVNFDENLLDEKLKTIETEVTQIKGWVTDEGIQIINGASGLTLPREEVYDFIKEQLGLEKSETGQFDYEVCEPDSVDFEEYLNMFLCEYRDAEYVRNEDGSIGVTEESDGVWFDVAAASDIMRQHMTEGEAYTIPCVLTEAANKKADLEAMLFRDVLGTYSTSFASSSASRGHNITLAASSINNIILMPGESFSFNDALGERTEARGYKLAGAYVAGQTVDQVGGGICQVSSTLYNAVLRANLEIVERRNHQMTVSYVPIGLDATVNWGTTDFRFKNNTGYPVKVVGAVNGKNVAATIVGTATIPNMKVEIKTNTTSVLSPEEQIITDDTKPVTYSSVKQGKNGYVVEAVRIVYSNGAEISSENLPKSRYNPTKTVKTVGTLPKEEPSVASQSTDNGYQLPPGLLPVEN